MRSPGMPISRLMKSVELSWGNLKTTTSPRWGGCVRKAAVHGIAERPAAEGKGIAAIAIGEFLDKQIVADQQVASIEAEGMLKGWNRKVRMHHRDQAGIDDGLGKFRPGFALGSGSLGGSDVWSWSGNLVGRNGQAVDLSSIWLSRIKELTRRDGAEIMTMAWAMGKSSVMERSICAR